MLFAYPKWKNFICLLIYLLIYLFIYLFIYVFIYLFMYLFIYLCIYLFISCWYLDSKKLIKTEHPNYTKV